jgi:hypothetical protein
VFTARYALSPYTKQIRFVFKGLKYGRQACKISVTDMDKTIACFSVLTSCVA